MGIINQLEPNSTHLSRLLAEKTHMIGAWTDKYRVMAVFDDLMPETNSCRTVHLPVGKSAFDAWSLKAALRQSMVNAKTLLMGSPYATVPVYRNSVTVPSGQKSVSYRSHSLKLRCPCVNVLVISVQTCGTRVDAISLLFL